MKKIGFIKNLSIGIRVGSIMVQETRNGVPAGVLSDNLQEIQQQLGDHSIVIGSIGAQIERIESSFTAL